MFKLSVDLHFQSEVNHNFDEHKTSLHAKCLTKCHNEKLTVSSNFFMVLEQEVAEDILHFV